MPNEPNKRGSFAVVLLIALLVPVLYILSIGPAGWLYDNQHLRGDMFIDVYRPVATVAYKSNVSRGLLNRYVGAWGGGIATFLLTHECDKRSSIYNRKRFYTDGHVNRTK